MTVSNRLAGVLAGVSMALALGLGGAPAHAAAADPAQAQVDAFDEALITAMKAGAAAGARGRERSLTPAVEGAFDLPLMTSFVVGRSFSTMTPAQKTALTRAFGRYTIANYAHNFDSWSGQKFEDQGVQTRGPDKLVQVRLVSKGSTTALVYRVHETAAGWKIVDVYYNGIGQLATRRADFAAAAEKGYQSLIDEMTRLTNSLLG